MMHDNKFVKTYRVILLLMALVLAAQTLAQSQPSINFTTPAIRLETALNEISKQAGKKLTTTDELSNEPIVLRLKDVPLQELLDKLADEFVAVWKPTKEGLELTRTPEIVEAFQQKIDADRLAAFQKTIDELAPLANSKPLTDAEAEQIAIAYTNMLANEKQGQSDNGQLRFTLEKRTADMRLFAQLVTAIGAKTLSNLSRGHHVFSPDPTAMELPIEGLDPAIIDEYVQQKNLLAKAIMDRWPKDTWDGYGNSAMFSSRNTVKPPLRIVVQVDSDPKSDAGWVSLNVYDSTNGNESSYSRAIGNGFNPETYPTERAKAFAASAKEQDVQLSGVEEELRGRYAVNKKIVTPPSADAIALLSTPDEHDPFTIFFSTIVLTESEREHRNLMASLPDDSWRFPRIAQKGVKPLYYESIITGLGFKIATFDRPDGWIIARSRNPIRASETRLSRSALANFVKAWADKGFDSIEDWSELATHVAPREEPSLVYTYWNLLRGEQMMSYTNDWEALRLYGLLSENQVNVLSSGQSLDFYTLSPEEQACLTRLVYENYQLRKANDPPSRRGRTENMSDTVQGADSIAQESVPNGIPQGAMLSARVDNHEMLTVREEWDSHPFDHDVDVNMLAASLVQAELQPVTPDGHKMAVDSVRYGSKKTITFTLTLNDKVKMQTELREDHFAQGDPIAPDQLKDKLPPELWQRLSAQMDKVREEWKKMKNHPQPVDDSPPPPPSPTRHY